MEPGRAVRARRRYRRRPRGPGHRRRRGAWLRRWRRAHSDGGLAAPRGRRRLAVVAITAAACGLAALALALAGRPLVGGTIHLIAQASAGSQATVDAARPADRRTGFRSADRCADRGGRRRAVRARAGAGPDPPTDIAGPRAGHDSTGIAPITHISPTAHESLKTPVSAPAMLPWRTSMETLTPAVDLPSRPNSSHDQPSDRVHRPDRPLQESGRRRRRCGSASSTSRRFTPPPPSSSTNTSRCC